jgi:hypothetical protein
LYLLIILKKKFFTKFKKAVDNLEEIYTIVQIATQSQQVVLFAFSSCFVIFGIIRISKFIFWASGATESQSVVRKAKTIFF